MAENAPMTPLAAVAGGLLFPGVIETPVRLAGGYDGRDGRLPPLGRAGQVSDVVNGILFLESSPYITGEILHIDGGLTAGR